MARGFLLCVLVGGILLGVLAGELVPGAATPAQVATVETIREATGANAAAVQATVDAFRVDLGNPNNGAATGPFPTGRREINWDGVPDADAAAGRFPGDFFHKVSPRGAVISTPGTGLQVSADAVNPATTAIEFGNLNATYPTIFQPFSVERLFTALGSNLTTVRFFVPGTSIPAGVRGFGALFTDVDLSGSTKIEYFDDEGELILSRDVLATPGDASLSFLGVKVSADDPVAEVRITSGAAALGPNDVTQTAGNPDVVVMDDFLYGEPSPLPPPPAVQFATPSFSGAEGATASLAVTRTGDLDESALVAFETRDGTARGGEDYLPAGGTVSFAAGETTKTIPVNLLSDAAVDDGETLTVALTVPAAGTTLGSPATAAVTIADVPDATNPGLTGLEVVPPAFELGRNSKAARVLFRLSEDARVTFSFERLVAGRRVEGKCVKPTPANRTAKRCTRVVTFRGKAVDAERGVNAVRLAGLITSRKLVAGRYRVVGKAVDSAGNRSSRQRAPFEVLKRGAR